MLKVIYLGMQVLGWYISLNGNPKQKYQRYQRLLFSLVTLALCLQADPLKNTLFEVVFL